jgi:hypothetical protein
MAGDLEKTRSEVNPASGTTLFQDFVDVTLT